MGRAPSQRFDRDRSAMDPYKLEPQPGDTNNSETLDNTMLVRTHTSPRAAAHLTAHRAH